MDTLMGVPPRSAFEPGKQELRNDSTLANSRLHMGKELEILARPVYTSS